MASSAIIASDDPACPDLGADLGRGTGMAECNRIVLRLLRFSLDVDDVLYENKER